MKQSFIGESDSMLTKSKGLSCAMSIKKDDRG